MCKLMFQLTKVWHESRNLSQSTLKFQSSANVQIICLKCRCKNATGAKKRMIMLVITLFFVFTKTIYDFPFMQEIFQQHQLGRSFLVVHKTFSSIKLNLIQLSSQRFPPQPEGAYYPHREKKLENCPDQRVRLSHPFLLTPDNLLLVPPDRRMCLCRRCCCGQMTFFCCFRLLLLG